jgi:hypothetical protein
MFQGNSQVTDYNYTSSTLSATYDKTPELSVSGYADILADCLVDRMTFAVSVIAIAIKAVYSPKFQMLTMR